MKIWTIATAVLSVALGGWYAWASRDDPLEPAVSEWLVAPADRSRESGNGWLYLVGILAGVGEEPEATALHLIGEEGEGANEQTYFAAEFRPEDLPVPPLKLPESALLCARGAAGCIAKLLAGADEASRLIARSLELLRRYGEFLRHTFYQTGTGRRARRIEPPYGALTVMNRLHHLSIVRDAVPGEPAKAAGGLTGDIMALRAMLPRLDDLMTKLTLWLALVEDYRLIAELYARGYLPPGAIDSDGEIFLPLTVAERSLEADMRRRFRNHAYDVYNFRGRRERRGAVFNPFGWSRRLVHKPNRTLNEAYPHFYRNYHLSILPPAEFLAEIRIPYDEHVRIERDNFVGSVLNREAVSNYEGYIGTLDDLDCFIRLVRIRVALPSGGPVSQEQLAALGARLPLGNPYDGRPPTIAPDGTSLCFPSRRSAHGADDLCIPL